MTSPKIIPIRSSRSSRSANNRQHEETESPPKRRGITSALSKIALWLLALGLAVAALLLIGMMFLGQEQTLSMATGGIKAMKPYAVVIHFVLIGIVAACWRQIVNHLAVTGRLSPVEAASVMSSRNRIVIALIVFEIVVVIGFPFRWL